jgi:hypothetical protein
MFFKETASKNLSLLWYKKAHLLECHIFLYPQTRNHESVMM